MKYRYCKSNIFANKAGLVRYYRIFCIDYILKSENRTCTYNIMIKKVTLFAEYFKHLACPCLLLFINALSSSSKIARQLFL